MRREEFEAHLVRYRATVRYVVDGDTPKAFLERLLPPGLAVYVRTYKDRTTFERLLGEVLAETEPGELRNVGDALVEAGHANRPERR